MEKLKIIFAYIVFISLIGIGIYHLIAGKHWLILGLIVAGVVFFIGFIFLLVGSLEGGFRNRFPMDYLFQIRDEIEFFTQRGFVEKDYLDPGTDKPGVALERKGIIIEVRLQAPLMASKYTIKISSMISDTESIEYDSAIEPSEKTLKLEQFYRKNLR